jgi:hypothetical protein
METNAPILRGFFVFAAGVAAMQPSPARGQDIRVLLIHPATTRAVPAELMVRVGPESYAQALKEPYVRAMDFTGRPMKGLVFVSPEGLESDAELERWVDRGLAHAATLPAKEPPLITARSRRLPAR